MKAPRILALLIAAALLFIGVVAVMKHRPDSDASRSGGGVAARLNQLWAAKGRDEREPGMPSDERLNALFTDEGTRLKTDDFRSFLDLRGWEPKSVLACYLLINDYPNPDHDRSLQKRLDVRSADTTVLALAPYLVLPVFDPKALADRLRSEEAGAALQGRMDLLNAVASKDLESSRSALRLIASGEGPDTASVAEIRDEMRAALESVSITGTRAEILIDQRGVAEGDLVMRDANLIRESWKMGTQELSGSELNNFAMLCLEALATLDKSGIPPSFAPLDCNREILKSLPGDFMIDGATAGDRLMKAISGFEEVEAYVKKIDVAFVDAEPEQVDRFYEILRMQGESAANAYLVPIP